MTVDNPGANGLVARAKRILLEPKPEWERIAAEPTTVGEVLRGWVVPLAAIGPVAGLIGALAFGYSLFGVTYRPPVGAAVGGAVVQYVLTIVGVSILAFVINALAPTFNATKDSVQAYKVAAYAGTAAFLAGIFNLLPAIAWLGILGLYSLYLLYLGLPRLMKAPAEKALSYTVVVILAAIVLGVVVGAVAGKVTSLITPRPSIEESGSLSGSVTVPGVGSVDLGKLEEASKQMEEAAKQAENGSMRPVSPDVLKGLLPETFAGLPRTEIESAGGGAGGIGGARAEATYEAGDQRIKLEVIDMAAMGALASLGGAFNVQSDRETADGYERTRTEKGGMVHEKWDRSSGQGSYGLTVANRFMISAEGKVADIDVLKQAVGAIDTAQIAALGRK